MDIDCTRSCKVSNVYRRQAFESVIFVLTCAVQTRGSLDLRGKVAANCAKQTSQQFSCGPRTSNFTPWDREGTVKPLQLTSGGSAERLPHSVCSAEIKAVPQEWFRAPHS